MNYTVSERPIEAGTLERPTGIPGNIDRAMDVVRGFEMPGSDLIRRFAAPQAGPQGPQMSPLSVLFPGLSTLFGSSDIPNLMQQLIEALQNFFNPNSNNAGSGYGDNERYFQNANGASVGDPHLSFNGTTWDNMGSQPDLLHSDSFQGGYQISTQTTAPSANGVTYNQSASVTTNYGSTSVKLDKDGGATIAEKGNSYPLSPGQTVDLGNGELATCNQDGSVQVTCDNGNGGQITTTMRNNGQGIDVNTSAHNVDLGGTLVDGAAQNGGATLTPFAHRHVGNLHPNEPVVFA